MKQVKFKGWFGWGSIGKAGAFRTDAPYKPDVFEATLILNVPNGRKTKGKKRDIK